MNRLAEIQTRSAGARLLAVAALFLLVFLGVSLGGSAVRLDEIASGTAVHGVSAQLRHGAMGHGGRTAISTARPSAKKTGSKGADDALPVAALTVIALGLPERALPQGNDSLRPEPATRGYRARAPPALV